MDAVYGALVLAAILVPAYFIALWQDRKAENEKEGQAA